LKKVIFPCSQRDVTGVARLLPEHKWSIRSILGCLESGPVRFNKQAVQFRGDLCTRGYNKTFDAFFDAYVRAKTVDAGESGRRFKFRSKAAAAAADLLQSKTGGGAVAHTWRVNLYAAVSLCCHSEWVEPTAHDGGPIMSCAGSSRGVLGQGLDPCNSTGINS